MAQKKYRDFTQEEKEIYKEKRLKWEQERAETIARNFDLLEVELKNLEVSDKILQLLNVCRNGLPKKGTGPNVTHLTTLFGTENPEVGQVSSFDYISLRGSNGERMNAGETKKDFIMRMSGDVTWTKDERTINEMVWYTNRRGYNIAIDKNAATVTFVGGKSDE
jgi:hypothetical protein